MPLAVVLLLSSLVSLPGCSVWQLAHRTMYSELREYPQVTDGKLACRQYQRWAKDEWKRVLQETGGAGFSSDYASGFVQGFVDQVYAGGKVQAPPMPPRKYWRIGYRNERGRRAVEDWYGGFRHGARVAREGGYREQTVIPSSLASGVSEVIDDAEPLFETEPEQGELLEPTPAEPIPVPADSEAVPPRPVPAEPILLEPSLDAAEGAAQQTPNDEPKPRMTSRESASGIPMSKTQPSVFEQPEKTTDLPADAFEADPNGPPIPPWHKPGLAGGTSDSPSGSGTVMPASFDPFDGTPFQESLGLTPADLVSPAKRPATEAQDRKTVPVEDPTVVETGSGALPGAAPRFTEAADPQNGAWQPPPPPPSTWKSRN